MSDAHQLHVPSSYCTGLLDCKAICLVRDCEEWALRLGKDGRGRAIYIERLPGEVYVIGKELK
jgi:hypothetical protein